MAEFRPPGLTAETLALAAQWRTTFAARARRGVAVWEEDRAAFVPVALAAWSLGLEVVLPGNLVSTTVEALRARVDALVGPLPGALSPAAEPTPFEARLEPDTCRLVLFTSGSTGTPVAIEKRLTELLEEVYALEATFGADLAGWAQVVSTVSHQHLYGLLFTVLWPLATGRRVAPATVATPEALEAALRRGGVSALVTVPAHLKRLPGEGRWPCELARVFSSGGPLPEEAALRCLRVLGTPATEVYGSTETGGIAWRTHPARAWRPLPGVTWRADAEGRLAVRSPFLPSADWFVTSDLVEPDEGSFRLVGRADRVAKLEEKRVSLGAIEAALRGGGLCDDARAVVLQGPRAEIGVVCLPSAAARALPRKALIERLRESLEGRVDRVALPRRFRF
ncbi:MAG: acyl-CoA synthetase, partial [Myxococcaceae bacterium]|nr:acyl-CoA synthetase [Myxococcaceae bacterium]